MKNLLKLSIFTLTIFFSSCTDKEGTKKTLEYNKYIPIEIGGYAWFMRSEGDFYATKFKAIAPNGEIVTGCVTRGVFKGNTVRIDN